MKEQSKASLKLILVSAGRPGVKAQFRIHFAKREDHEKQGRNHQLLLQTDLTSDQVVLIKGHGESIFPAFQILRELL